MAHFRAPASEWCDVVGNETLWDPSCLNAVRMFCRSQFAESAAAFDACSSSAPASSRAGMLILSMHRLSATEASRSATEMVKQDLSLWACAKCTIAVFADAALGYGRVPAPSGTSFSDNMNYACWVAIHAPLIYRDHHPCDLLNLHDPEALLAYNRFLELTAQHPGND